MKKFLAITAMLATVSCATDKPYNDVIVNNPIETNNKSETIFYETLRLSLIHI